MQSFPAHFACRNEQPLVCIVGAGFAEAVNQAYEEDGEVELVEPGREIAIEMPSYHRPQDVILVGPGGEASIGAGTGMPWESFCWYAPPEIVGIWMTRSGPCTGCYAVCKVQLRVREGADKKFRTWWGYSTGAV